MDLAGAAAGLGGAAARPPATTAGGVVRAGSASIQVGGSAFRTFGERYRDDLAGFASDCVRWPRHGEATGYQREILQRLTSERRVCVRSPHGAGKSATAALAILGFSLTRAAVGADWKVITTASVWRQLSKYLWPEVHKIARWLRWDVIGRQPFDPRELLTMQIKLTGGEAFAIASNDHEKLEGGHADSILVVLDEGKAIPPKTWDALEGVFSGGAGTEALALAISTPGAPGGRFHEIQTRRPGTEDWWTRHITLAETVASGRLGMDWAEQRKRQWTETSQVYQNRVLGQFATSEEDGVIPLAWVEAANERWRDWDEAGRPGPLVAVGVDVARSGSDQTVMAALYGNAIGELRKHRIADTMTVTGHVVNLLTGGVDVTAIVDVLNVGAGVVDRLREMEHKVVAFGAGEATTATDASGELHFRNLRSAAWWNLREELDPANSPLLALPPDDELTGDLTAPRWRVGSSGRIEVEPKDNGTGDDVVGGKKWGVKQRLGRSTDCGDAVVQVAWLPRVAAAPVPWYLAAAGGGR